jgi:predicted dehydrogenase
VAPRHLSEQTEEITMPKYRVAVVGGAGTWGRFYMRAYAEHPDCEIIALVDGARDRRQAFADRYGAQAVFDTVEELLDREVPDIVSAIVPVGQNRPVVLACAEAGVRVVSCEKPLAVQLSDADDIVRICRERGTLFACGQSRWITPYMSAAMDWVRAGNIGKLTAAAIPGGLPVEVSGGGCVQLSALRILTGMDVAWVEGYTLPPIPRYVAYPDGPQVEKDCPAYGRLGLTGGIICEIPAPGDKPERPSSFVTVEGEEGQVFLSSPQPVLLHGKGVRRGPVFPDFLQQPPAANVMFNGRIEALMHAFDTGEEPASSGADYRHALEVAIALVRSAADGHRRIELPLKDRSLRLFPALYREKGGDIAGWQSIGYAGPPDLPE